MQYLLYLILAIFLYFNMRIIFFDIREKKIPNRYLLYILCLLPFYYVLFFVFGLNISGIDVWYGIWGFWIQFFLAFMISFFLYYHWIWSAWDAKYLLVLSLFLPNIGIIPFIWNISIVTIIYLFLYFLYFYLIKNVFNSRYRKSLFWDMYKDLKERTILFFQDSQGVIYKREVIKKVLKWGIIFLIIFVSLRLFRLYLYSFIFSEGSDETTWRIWFVVKYLKEYNVYIILMGVIIFLWGFYLFRRWIGFVRKYITNRFRKFLDVRYGINPELTDTIFLSILALCLIAFIFFEYFDNPYKISRYLRLIFTTYMFFLVLFRFLMYSYRIAFQVAEQDFIKIKDLKERTIVDKDYLIKLFGTQRVLGNEENKDGILYPSPKEYFKNMDNPIDKETAEILKDVYRIVNDYHREKNTPNFSRSEYIKILKTFAFGTYIFLGFLLTFFYSDYLFKSFVEFLGETLLKK